MSTTLYLIRHAEAEGNLGRRCHGIYNSMLTPLGMIQAKAVAQRFKDIRLDKVYSSDLRRAIDTARQIADIQGLEVQQRGLLREIDMGDWEDKPWAELAVFQSEAYEVWCKRPWDCCPPNGETIIHAGQRVFDELRSIAKQNDGKTIAVVSHGTVIRGVLTIACGLKPENINDVGWGDNTCVSRLIYMDDGSIKVDYRNDNSHLTPDISTFNRIKWNVKEDIPVSPQLWYRPVSFDDETDRKLALELFRSIYKPEYSRKNYSDDEIEHMLRDFQSVTPEAVVFGIYGSEAVGITALNTVESQDNEIGEMGGTAILPKFRGYGFGAQFTGHAVSVYRKMGKTKLLARPSVHNPDGEKFYLNNGFAKIGEIGEYLILQRPLV